jgi:hypothetical protein
VLLVLAVIKASLTRVSDSAVGTIRVGLAIAFVSAFLFEGLTGSFEDTRHLWILMGLILAVRQIDEDSNASPALNSA